MLHLSLLQSLFVFFFFSGFLNVYTLINVSKLLLLLWLLIQRRSARRSERLLSKVSQSNCEHILRYSHQDLPCKCWKATVLMIQPCCFFCNSWITGECYPTYLMFSARLKVRGYTVQSIPLHLVWTKCIFLLVSVQIYWSRFVQSFLPCIE